MGCSLADARALDRPDAVAGAGPAGTTGRYTALTGAPEAGRLSLAEVGRERGLRALGAAEPASLASSCCCCCCCGSANAATPDERLEPAGCSSAGRRGEGG